MKNRTLTIFVLRRNIPSFRRLHLPYGMLATGGGILAGLVLITLLVPQLWLKLQAQSETAQRLAQENRELHAERARIEGSLAEVSGRLEAFESWAGRMARELGIENLPSSAPPAGGGSFDANDANDANRNAGDGLSDEMQSLAARADGLDRSFQVLDQAAERRLDQAYAIPGMMPVGGWLSHDYGWRADPFTGEPEFHRGVDIVAPVNSAIQASADGVVAEAGRQGAYGKTVEIIHGHGWSTRYAHLNAILVEAGDRVRRGDLIGRVGSTGRSTGPHLHYEIHRDGQPVNPGPYLDPAVR